MCTVLRPSGTVAKTSPQISAVTNLQQSGHSIWGQPSLASSLENTSLSMRRNGGTQPSAHTRAPTHKRRAHSEHRLTLTSQKSVWKVININPSSSCTSLFRTKTDSLRTPTTGILHSRFSISQTEPLKSMKSATASGLLTGITQRRSLKTGSGQISSQTYLLSNPK